jgi:hypothetical protein
MPDDNIGTGVDRGARECFDIAPLFSPGEFKFSRDMPRFRTFCATMKTKDDNIGTGSALTLYCGLNILNSIYIQAAASTMRSNDMYFSSFGFESSYLSNPRSVSNTALVQCIHRMSKAFGPNIAGVIICERDNIDSKFSKAICIPCGCSKRVTIPFPPFTLLVWECV